jgi:superfamily I DNA/RNA helicase
LRGWQSPAHRFDGERRTAPLYVGMTRARHRLILSSAMEEGLESRFLEEPVSAPHSE